MRVAIMMQLKEDSENEEDDFQAEFENLPQQTDVIEFDAPQ